MPESIQVDGVAICKTCTTGGTLATLGRSKNGVHITEHLFTGEVHGDDNGGEEGPPIDVQYFGEIHVARLELTKYDETVIDTVRAGLAGGTAGTPGTSGTLYFQGAAYWRLLIHSTSRPRNYLRAIYKEPKEINKGTKFSTAIVVATCYKDATVVYNAVIT